MQNVAQHFKVQAEEMWNGNINKAKEEDGNDSEDDVEMHCGAKKWTEKQNTQIGKHKQAHVTII